MRPRFLLDTHILLRWMMPDGELSREQRRVLEEADRRAEPLSISAMSCLEIAFLVRDGRFKLRISLVSFFDELQSHPLLQVLPLTHEVALEGSAFAGGLRDPADCVIVATARVHCLRLITSDQHIIESKLVPVVE